MTSDAALIKEGYKKYIQEGQSFNLTCEGNQSLRWTYPNNQISGRTNQINQTNKLVLKVNDSRLADSGLYICTEGKDAEIKAIHIKVIALPSVTIPIKTERYFKGKTYRVKCVINTEDPYNVTWLFRNCTNYTSCAENDIVVQLKSRNSAEHTYHTEEQEVKALNSGKFNCKVCNVIGCRTTKDPLFFFVEEMNLPNFKQQQKDQNRTIKIGKEVSLDCSVQDLTGCEIQWFKDEKIINLSGNKYRRQLRNMDQTLFIKSSENSDRGIYKCRVKCVGGNIERKISILIEMNLPNFKQQQKDQNRTIKIGKEVSLDCSVQDLTGCEIQWFKDEKIINQKGNKSRCQLRNMDQTLFIKSSENSDKGIYKCRVKCVGGNIERNFSLLIAIKSSKILVVTAVVGILLIAILLIAFLIWRKIKVRKQVDTLSVRDVTSFYEGVLLTVDPDLGIDDQADLLPYKKGFEFPRDKLKLGKQLGTGAFGRVVKAEAEGLIEQEKFSTIAVKMVNPNSDISHLKALMTELKILIYIGHHLNILNLLGACTTNLIRKELFVLLEYCRYGNLHSYIQRNRKSFINQINPLTDMVDFSIGIDTLQEPDSNRPLVNLSGEMSKEFEVMFDNTSRQSLLLGTTGENPMSKKDDCPGSSDSANLKWNITYDSDLEGNVAINLTTKDLLCWSYQIAMGMEYLESCKVAHADLAARNILLADENIVKICNFGMMQNLCKNVDYKNKEVVKHKGECRIIQDHLPVEWMAIESIEDGIYSTKSDVWSFGVVLWELFSLAKHPYPGMEVNEEFLQQLIKGSRMSKPEYSTHEMYRVMLGCWKEKPSDRPCFKDLVHRIGDSLGSDITQRYRELNEHYLNPNVEAADRKTCVNYCNESKSEVIKHECPEYVNMKQFDDVLLSKTNVASKEKLYTPELAGEPVYSSMT